MAFIDILATVYTVPGGYRIVPEMPLLLQLMLWFVPWRGSFIAYIIVGVGLYYYTTDVDREKVSKFEATLGLYLAFCAIAVALMIFWYLAHSEIVAELPPHLADQVR